MVRQFLILAALAAAPFDTARAADVRDLFREGYEVAWGGFAAITTCLGPEDRYQIGPYQFVCDGVRDGYPFHYGTVFLVARVTEEAGKKQVSTYLCLEAKKGEDQCFSGKVYR